MAIYNLKCQWCGKDFSCTHKNQKYCGRECYDKSRKGKAPVFGTTKEIPCPQCNKIFKQRQANSKFCSRECQATWHGNEKMRGKGYTRLIQCKTCGKEFLRDSIENIFCSTECFYEQNIGERNSSYLSDKELSENALKEGYTFISRGKKTKRGSEITYKCNSCGEITTNNRIRFTCAFCRASKGEMALKQYCESNNLQYEFQYKDNRCKHKKILAFDFAIFSNGKLMALIEYQGGQHYEAVEWFGGEVNFKKQKKRDNIKREFCNLNNIPLIEIPYIVKDIENYLDEQLDQININIQLSILL